MLTPDQLRLVAIGLHHLEIGKIESGANPAGHEGESLGLTGQGAGGLPEACCNDVLGLMREWSGHVFRGTDGTERDTAWLVAGRVPRPKFKRRAFEVHPDLI